MIKLKSTYLLNLALSAALMSCVHSSSHSQFEQFSEIPRKTEWQITYLKDFNNTEPYVTASGLTKQLQDYSIIGVKNEEFELFYLERIPFCEGAGGSISTIGKVEYIQLQGACTDLILRNGEIQEVLSFVSVLERNLLRSLIEDGTVWHLDGKNLKLKRAKGVTLGEFLRIK